MNQKIDQALRQIELSKKAISDAELILAELLQEDNVPSVIEPEPMQQVKEDMKDVGMEFTDKTPPRTDLQCPLCTSKVYDNRPNKESGQYKATAPDFSCSNNNDCSGMTQGNQRMLRKAWWLDSKDLPQDWINTTVPVSADDDRVVVDPPRENAEDIGVPFN